LNAPDEEVAEVIKGDENVMKIALRFISRAATSI
jgi:hypothetical protein